MKTMYLIEASMMNMYGQSITKPMLIIEDRQEAIMSVEKWNKEAIAAGRGDLQHHIKRLLIK